MGPSPEQLLDFGLLSQQLVGLRRGRKEAAATTGAQGRGPVGLWGCRWLERFREISIYSHVFPKPMIDKILITRLSFFVSRLLEIATFDRFKNFAV